MEDEKETVVLEIEGSSIECVKELLVSNSDYFFVMFKGSFRESYQKNIKIEGVDLKSFNTILLLLWDQSYIIDKNEIHLVLQAACMLQFNGIKKICENRIIEMLSPSIALRIWKTTELLNISPLCLKAKCMALEEFMQICDTESILELSLEDICSYLGHINLNAKSEFSVFQTIMSWWYENQEDYAHIDSTKLVLRLFSCIDFKKLDKNQIKEIKTYPDISNNTEIISVLNCVLDLKINGINISDEFSREQLANAINLCNSKSRETPEIPCILLQNNWSRDVTATKRCKFDEPNKDGSSVVIYDISTDKLKDFFLIDEDKVRDLAGFKLLSYKEFVFLYGGEYLLGVGNWNCNFWTYDTFKERWERKNMLPHGRRHFETIIVEDTIYIIGGIGRFRVLQDNFLCYNFKDDKWSSLIPLPTFDRQLKCCTFYGQLFIVYLMEKRAYFFNKEMKTWRKINILVEKEVIDALGNYTVFTDTAFFYVKGKHLLRFTLDGENLILTTKKEMGHIEYEEMESVLCNNIVYTLYKCLDDHYDTCYTLEALYLDTFELRYIFENKVQGRDTLEVDGKPYYLTSHTKLFSFHYYHLIKDNIPINDVL